MESINIENKKLVKCDTCGNMAENTNDPFERGSYTVYSDSHKPHNWGRIEWCRSEGCIKKAKKMSKEYLKFLQETSVRIICPNEGRIKEQENILKTKEKYKELYGWEIKE